MVVPPTLPADKTAARAAMRSLRLAFVDALAAGERAALEAALAATIRTHLPPGAVIAAYAPHGAEIDPGGVAPAMALPWFADAMSACRFRRGPATERGPFGVRQPARAQPIVQPAVILAPLLAADRHGHRLGQGGGHYDRLLAALPDRAAVIVIGCAWDMQIVAGLDPDPWDMPLDAVATPTRWIATGS